MLKRISVRLGALRADGAYYSFPIKGPLPDPSDYYCPCFDITSVKIYDWREPTAAILLLHLAHMRCTQLPHTRRGIGYIKSEIESIEEGNAPWINGEMIDETPLMQAVQELGYGGVLVMEVEGDMNSASLFISDTDSVHPYALNEP